MLINPSSMSESEKERFVNAFYANWPAEYELDLVPENPNPWGCPWYYETEIEVFGSTPEEWGQSWWDQNQAEIMRLLESGY